MESDGSLLHSTHKFTPKNQYLLGTESPCCMKFTMTTFGSCEFYLRNIDMLLKKVFNAMKKSLTGHKAHVVTSDFFYSFLRTRAFGKFSWSFKISLLNMSRQVEFLSPDICIFLEGYQMKMFSTSTSLPNQLHLNREKKHLVW